MSVLRQPSEAEMLAILECLHVTEYDPTWAVLQQFERFTHGFRWTQLGMPVGQHGRCTNGKGEVVRSGYYGLRVQSIIAKCTPRTAWVWLPGREWGAADVSASSVDAVTAAAAKILRYLEHVAAAAADLIVGSHHADPKPVQNLLLSYLHRTDSSVAVPGSVAANSSVSVASASTN